MTHDEYRLEVAKMRTSMVLGHLAEEAYLEDVGIFIPDEKYQDWLASWLIGEGWVQHAGDAELTGT